MVKRPIVVEEGQHYESSRGWFYTIDYINDDIVLLYDGENYRLERIDHFKEEIESGRYELKEEINISTSEERIPLEDIPSIGEKATDSLRSAGLETPKDFDHRSDEKILQLESVGEKGLSNIYDWIDRNVTETVEI